MRDGRRRAEIAARVAALALSLLPLALLAADTIRGRLGTNPIETATHRTGWWALAFLLLTLAVTPARQLTGWGSLIKLRRLLGLFAFFYATLHLAIYVGVDQFFAFEYMLEDVRERPYITVGFTAFLILVPLAATSTKRMVRRLGGKRWGRLHRLVYVAAALGVLHFLWLVKADIREPTIFGLILSALLAFRVVAPRLRRAASHPSLARSVAPRPARGQALEEVGAPPVA
jgi:sulfoxide reductase heme-binding subunit YedZ